MTGLADVRLGGSVKRTRNQLSTNACPVCGGKPKRYDRVFTITEKPWGLVAYCQLCNASQTAISRALGIHVGAYKVTKIDNHDPGPFYADAEVLRAIRKGVTEILHDFTEGPGDEIGEVANLVHWHVIPSRRKVPRLQYPAEVAPFSYRFVARVARKLGRKISTETALTVAARIKAHGVPSWHFFQKAKAERLGYRGICVVAVTALRTHAASGFNNSELSCSPMEQVNAPGTLDRLLGALNLAHGPPAEARA